MIFFVLCFNKVSSPSSCSSDALTISPDDLSLFDVVHVPEEAADLLCQTKPHSATGPDGITATGPDGITTWILRIFAPKFSFSIASMFTLQIKSSHLPAVWNKYCSCPQKFKIQLTMMHNLFDPSIYFPPFARQSKAIFSNNFLISNNVKSDKQFGFRKDYLATVPLLLATHNWHSLLDHGAQIGCTFFNLSKAFDSVPHQALLNKLHRLSVPPILIKWIANYLCERQIIKLATSQIWGSPRFHPWPPSFSPVRK